MRNVVRCLAAAAAVVVAGGSADAQQQRPGGRPGGFGGGGVTFLVRNEAVQEDIKLTSEQKEKLTEWSKGFREKAQEKMKDLPRDDREKWSAAMAEINKEAEKEIAAVLKPEQMSRLKQIGLQSQGNMALQNVEVQEKLAFTDDQKAELKTIGEEARKEMRELFDGGRPDRTKMQALQKEVGEKVQKLLTADQKTKWKELTGEPFDTSKLMQGFGGRRPGGNSNNND